MIFSSVAAQWSLPRLLTCCMSGPQQLTIELSAPFFALMCAESWGLAMGAVEKKPRIEDAACQSLTCRCMPVKTAIKRGIYNADFLHQTGFKMTFYDGTNTNLGDLLAPAYLARLLSVIQAGQPLKYIFDDSTRIAIKYSTSKLCLHWDRSLHLSPGRCHAWDLGWN